LITRCREANANYPRGLADRQDIAQFRARSALRTQGICDPPCQLCESTHHLSDECDYIARETHAISEDATTSIHHAIIHRLYLQTYDLYKLAHPRFFPGDQETTSEIYPASLPDYHDDYLDIAISLAVEDFRVLPGFRPDDIRNQHAGCSPIIQLYYSKAFPITFGDSCYRIADSVETLLPG
jgi:hypothetical protein